MTLPCPDLSHLSADFAQVLARADAGEALSDADFDILEQVRSHWPYAVVADMLALKSNKNVERLHARIALEVDCPETIDRLRAEGWADFYPPLTRADNTPDTTDAISLFLDKYGHQSPEEDAMLERMIFNPTPDYAEVLAREEQENLPDQPADPDSPQGRIDAFILSRHPAAAPEPIEPPQPKESRTPVHRPAKDAASDSGSLLSESLAAVYIRQKRYKKAYEILSELSVKYPRRNIIIQPQLSFLRKLIINSGETV